MPTITKISTTPDVVALILEHTHVTDGLRFARVSTVWRDASHAVCGIASMLGKPSRPMRCDGRPVVDNGRFEYIWSVCQLPRGNICLVDYRQVRLLSPEPTDYNMLVSPARQPHCKEAAAVRSTLARAREGKEHSACGSFGQAWKAQGGQSAALARDPGGAGAHDAAVNRIKRTIYLLVGSATGTCSRSHAQTRRAASRRWRGSSTVWPSSG